MIQRIYRLLFVLFIVAGASRTFAQTNASSDIGLWLIQPQLSETTFTDDEDDVTLDFDEDLGFGVSYNRFWTDAFSTEFGAQKYGADMTLGATGSPAVTVGELDVTALSAIGQLHFNRAGRFSVFAGAGAAYLMSEFDPSDDDPDSETEDLESEVTWTAAVGANVALTERIALTGEIRYTPWSATAEGDDDSDALDIDPLTFSAGVRFRF